MPAIRSASMRAVAEVLRSGASIVAPVFNRRRGHPVGFAGEWFDLLSALTDDSGGRAVIDAHPDRLTLLAVDDPGVLIDVDSESDLARLLSSDSSAALG
jgi:molybdenum cofactor cytidylyltransferase